MGFKDWLRTDLNNTVQSTVAAINEDEPKEGYANQIGQCAAAQNAGNNYEPNPPVNSILGVPYWILGGIVVLALIGVAGYVAHKEGNNKLI